MRIGMIWAQDRNRIIGSGHDMLWHVPADFQHFKATTMGRPIVMGRNSWEALGRPLPGRQNIVLTRQPASQLTVPADLVFSGLSECLAELRARGEKLVWITGGAQVYEQALPLADLLVVTELDLDVSDKASTVVKAPFVDPQEWDMVSDKSDPDWLPTSGDAKWRRVYYQRKTK